MKALFAKKIVCSHCLGFYKRKIYRSRRVYICTNSDKGKCDVRIPIEENFIKDLVYRRVGQISDDEIINVLDHVEIKDKWNMKVYFKNDNNVMIINGNFNQY